MTASPFARNVAAIATPFHPDLGVDCERLVAHARWLFENGCDGLVLFGTTGEAASLTVAERKAVLGRLAAANIPPETIVVGTGCCAIPDTVELSRHAHAVGAAGALILPPYFYKGVSDDGIAAFYDRVIEGCGAELPPVYLYHIPQVAGAGVSPALVARLVARHGERIRGYKDSSGDWRNTADLLARFPALAIFVGSEVLLRETLQAGGAGCISASVNVQPARVRKAIETWRGSEGEAAQAACAAVRKVLEQAGPLVAGVKAVLARLHRHEGWTVPRPPLDALPEAAAQKLFAALQALGLEGF